MRFIKHEHPIYKGNIKNKEPLLNFLFRCILNLGRFLRMSYIYSGIVISIDS